MKHTQRIVQDETYQCVFNALRAGYRHVDTASIYKNEAQVGRAVNDFVDEFTRSNPDIELRLEVTTKLSPHDCKSLSSTQQAIQKCLSTLSLPNKRPNVKIDTTLLIHWPGISGLATSSEENARHRIENWSAMEESYQKGEFTRIGVSNFTVSHLHGTVIKLQNQTFR